MPTNAYKISKWCNSQYQTTMLGICRATWLYTKSPIQNTITWAHIALFFTGLTINNVEQDDIIAKYNHYTDVINIKQRLSECLFCYKLFEKATET